MPMQAVRRLLEESETEPLPVLMIRDRDLNGNGQLRLSSIWDPPELLIPCQVSERRGES
jgi:hypothetical protein